MPFSSNSGKHLVDRAVIRLVKSRLFQKGSVEKNKQITVLDVGAGSGTYSDRFSRTWLRRPDTKWTALEVWEPYVEKYQLHEKYDEVKVEKAQDFFAKTDLRHVDLCFMGDVLEHMSVDEASKVVDSALDMADVVIACLPIGHYPQDEYDGNPYEKHVKDDWTIDAALQMLPNVCFWGQESEIGVFVCSRNRSYDVTNLLAPQVGVYVICKNEKEFISRCIQSTSEADKIVVCDTGSTDGTFEHLKELASLYPKIDVKQILVSPWRFDDAKNTALFLLPEEIDVAISLDADELIERGSMDLLKDSILADLHSKGRPSDRYNHRFKTIWDWRGEGKSVSEHWHERIHARHGYMWKLPVHEILVKQNGDQDISWVTNFNMIQMPDTKKSRSYLTLLEQSVKEDPKIWKSWSFLATEYLSDGRYDAAIKCLETALDLDCDKAFIYNQISRIYWTKGDLEAASFEMMRAIRSSPIREYRVYLAQIYYANKQYSEAVAMMEQAQKITERSFGYEYNASCWGSAFDDYFNILKSTKEAQ